MKKKTTGRGTKNRKKSEENSRKKKASRGTKKNRKKNKKKREGGEDGCRNEVSGKMNAQSYMGPPLEKKPVLHCLWSCPFHFHQSNRS